MFRATTPKHTFIFDVDAETLFSEILITYAQNGQIILNKSKDDLTFETDIDCHDETIYLASLRLTQQETNSFSTRSGDKVTVQVRAKTMDGDVVAFNKMTISLQDVLNDEVML